LHGLHLAGIGILSTQLLRSLSRLALSSEAVENLPGDKRFSVFSPDGARDSRGVKRTFMNRCAFQGVCLPRPLCWRHGRLIQAI